MDKDDYVKVKLKTILIVVGILLIMIMIGIIVIQSVNKLNDINNEEENIVSNSNASSEVDYVYSEEIDSITVRYYEGYNIASGNDISDTIPLNEIELQSSELETVSNLISELTLVQYSEDDEEYEHMIYDYISDEYEIEINSEFTIYIGDTYGFVKENDEYFEVPDELCDAILEIVEEYNNENLYKNLDSENFSIIYDDEILEVEDEDQIEELSNCQYYVINASEDDFETEEVGYILDLGDGRKINIYKDSILGYISYEDDSCEYIYSRTLESCVNKIYNNSKVKIEETAELITVTYEGKEYEINDQEEIEEILRKLKNIEYNDYNYLESTKETDFDESDIKIYINNSEYIISESDSYVIAYFMDEDGKFYDIKFYNSDLEEYFKDLVGYNE